jgi:hypothetical protein
MNAIMKRDQCSFDALHIESHIYDDENDLSGSLSDLSDSDDSLAGGEIHCRCSSPTCKALLDPCEVQIDNSDLSHCKNESCRRDWLMERCGNNSQFLAQVWAAFCQEGRQHMDAMQKAILDKDHERLAFEAASWLFSLHYADSQL